MDRTYVELEHAINEETGRIERLENELFLHELSVAVLKRLKRAALREPLASAERMRGNQGNGADSPRSAGSNEHRRRREAGATNRQCGRGS